MGRTKKTGPLTVADEVDRLGRRRTELVGQWVIHRGRRQRVHWTRWSAHEELEISFEATGGVYFKAAEMTLADEWKPLSRKRLDTFMASMIQPTGQGGNRDATLADLRPAFGRERIATASDVLRHQSRASTESARQNGPVRNAEGGEAGKPHPPRLCDSGPPQTAPSPGTSQRRLGDGPSDENSSF